jgi:sensor histidine kinase YesM
MTRSPTDTPLRLERRHWLAILAFWTFMGLLESSKAWVTADLSGRPTSLSNALLGNMPWWYFWALATPAAFWIAQRFPLDRGRTVRFLAVHFLAMLAFAVTHAFVVGWLFYQTHARFNVPSYLGLVRAWLVNYGMLNVLTYSAVVGAYYALRYHGRMRQSQDAAAKLELRAAQLQASMTESRLNALRMELNPHFLFNTLNAISGLVRRRERAAAVQALARLGDLLRVTLDRAATQTVPLSQEMVYLQYYLDIERIRFQDRLQIEIDVGDDVVAAAVPSLILQPLVENAVRHGIAKKPGTGWVRIEARRNGDALQLRVADSGVGFPEDLRALREGVGLGNTRARLDQLYNGRSSFVLANNEQGGATVSLTLPFELCSATDTLYQQTLDMEAV